MTTTNVANTRPAVRKDRAAPKPQGQLFDLRERADGKWLVWVRKTPIELGMVDTSRVDPANVAEFLAQPHLTDQSVWVIAKVYDAKPSVETVLSDLGVERKERKDGAPRRPATRKPVPQRAEAEAERIAASF